MPSKPQAFRPVPAPARTNYDVTRRKQDPALAFAAKIRNSAQWQKMRTLHRAIEPFCRDPFSTHTAMRAYNECSHHILPLATHPELAFVMSNLAGLCTHCHGRVERLEREGKATAALFPPLVVKNDHFPTFGTRGVGQKSVAFSSTPTR